MSAVVGIDLSTQAIDIVALDESTNRAEWHRVELEGQDAWRRTLGIGARMPSASWYEDRGVFLVAVEVPFGTGRAATAAVLNRVVGAVAASLPPHLRVPERCWLVAPREWKAGLGLKGKPTWDDLPSDQAIFSSVPRRDVEVWQNARDAYCMAMWARDTNALAVAAA